jgi:hypothetical protein
MIPKISYINIALALICALLLFKTIDVWRSDPTPSGQWTKIREGQSESPGKGGGARLVDSRVPPKSAFENIGAKNLFSADRAEYLPPAAEVEEIGQIAEEQAPKVDGRQIQLFGVVLMQDVAKALISDPSVKSGRGQSRWVAPGDSIGQLRVDSVEPDSVVLADERQKRFRVALHAANKARSGVAAAPATAAARPTVVTTQPTPETRPAAATATSASSTTTSQPERPATVESPPGNKDYVIIQTPFGEMRRPRNQP